MATLESLVRTNRWALDEKRKSHAEILRLMESFRAELDRLDAELMAGSRVADSASPVEAAGALATHAEEARSRRQKLRQTLSELETAEEMTRAELAAIHQEVKSYELALSRAERRKRLASEGRERAPDEQAGTFTRRRS